MIAVSNGFSARAADLAPKTAEEDDEVEEQGDGYGVYSKRVKERGRLEDRYSAVLGLRGDCNEVNSIWFSIMSKLYSLLQR